MAGDESNRERAFKVQDRRRFSDTGEAREDVEEHDEPAPESQPESAQTAPPQADADNDKARSKPKAEISFHTFIISLSTQALAHLGEIPDLVDKSVRVDLDAARQVIDILGLLWDKTRGNLDSAESSLLESALYDLRMKYVDKTHGR